MSRPRLKNKRAWARRRRPASSGYRPPDRRTILCSPGPPPGPTDNATGGNVPDAASSRRPAERLGQPGTANRGAGQTAPDRAAEPAESGAAEPPGRAIRRWAIRRWAIRRWAMRRRAPNRAAGDGGDAGRRARLSPAATTGVRPRQPARARWPRVHPPLPAARRGSGGGARCRRGARTAAPQATPATPLPCPCDGSWRRRRRGRDAGARRRRRDSGRRRRAGDCGPRSRHLAPADADFAARDAAAANDRQTRFGALRVRKRWRPERRRAGKSAAPRGRSSTPPSTIAATSWRDHGAEARGADGLPAQPDQRPRNRGPRYRRPGEAHARPGRRAPDRGPQSAARSG